TDGDDTNNGTILAPLATISAAVTKCTDTSKKYTICIDGTITLGSTISVNDNKKITFSGINGSDTDIIDGGHTSGTDGYLIMNIDNGSTVTIENLKLQHGYNHINDKGGGLCNNGTLTVKNSIIISCLAKTLGGGIYNDSTGNLTIAGSTIKSCNHSGIYNYGGTFTMDGGTISGNAADNVGGGIDNENGTVYMSGGTITGNTANNNGGGVYNTGTFNMSGGTISGNTAKTKGGGVYNAGGTFTMSGDDTTITYNKVTASNGVGGGVYNAGTFNMSGSAVIDAETAGANDVYLSSGKYITVTGALTPESNTNLTGETKSAVITPNGYSTGTIVVVLSEGVTETTLADEVGNFSLSDTNYVIKNNGKIAVAPDNVTSFAAATGDGQIKLSWTNPSDSDFSKAVVTWTTTADTSTQVGTEDVSGTAGAAGTYTVTGLTNGTSYTFTVKAFDTSNNASSGVTVTQYPMYGLTETPVTLAAGTDGTAGTSGTYVKFGDWPQTIKAGSVTVSTNTASNGYYYGSDGYYYANVSAAPYGTYTFSDGTAVTGDSTYYFKVEPIKWRVLSGAGTSNALVAAESILTNIRYYGTINRRKLDSTTIYANNYKYSNIRAYLNGTANQYVTDGGTATSYDIDWTDKGFLQTAFTSTARAKIQTTTVDNSLEQMSYDGTDGTSSTYVCDDTNDKVFLLSEAEAVNTTYYAVYSAVGSSSKRMKKVCDYARATGAKMTTDQGYDQYCGWWWLRSPLFCGDYSARVVQNSGNAGYNEDVDSTYDGVAPALLLSFQ
ncbi:MAG: fibronectin type III domain-containing protein, partial [Treponema sp.]|nr:fibronectin type III domain-containing protein [Treponema sp.]